MRGGGRQGRSPGFNAYVGFGQRQRRETERETNHSNEKIK